MEHAQANALARRNLHCLSPHKPSSPSSHVSRRSGLASGTCTPQLFGSCSSPLEQPRCWCTFASGSAAASAGASGQRRQQQGRQRRPRASSARPAALTASSRRAWPRLAPMAMPPCRWPAGSSRGSCCGRRPRGTPRWWSAPPQPNCRAQMLAPSSAYGSLWPWRRSRGGGGQTGCVTPSTGLWVALEVRLLWGSAPVRPPAVHALTPPHLAPAQALPGCLAGGGGGPVGAGERHCACRLPGHRAGAVPGPHRAARAAQQVWGWQAACHGTPPSAAGRLVRCERS